MKYQISLPMMDDDDEASNITPKQALMGWVKSKLPPEVFMRKQNKRLGFRNNNHGGIWAKNEFSCVLVKQNRT